MDKTWIVIIAAIIIVVMNLASFLTMRHDKQCAKRGARRVPERTLFIVTACFGGLGGVLGMQLLRHKTQHWYFKVFFPVLLILQVALLCVGAFYLFS